ncbi:Type II secretory pathway, component PulK [Serratia ficaria]|uniref:type II secretion system minor pseudopilin GspK n=1 Tax=Serratia ficaria TaxID=61651 RepID=UPI00217AC9FB|nr:type II secretion system minor pseudopilin GspK [Serratia ficaria]CAI2092081.1 Type II secretory pathway, component PulK [Serratia ficaria]CAI2463688.1 Type II secretory pathway, component PulK [Serratia ficaria]
MKNEGGMALLVVMMFLLLMAATAVSVNHSWYNMYTRTNVQLSRTQAKWHLLGAEAYAIKLLEDSLRDATRVAPNQKWAQPALSFSAEDARIKINFHDAQACFNLNTLSPPQTHVKAGDGHAQAENGEIAAARQNISWQVFGALLANLGFNAEESKRLSDSIEQRLSPGMTAFSDISELRPLPGMTRERYMRVLPFMCVLPERKTSININSLGDTQLALLRALFLNKASAGAVRRLLDSRPREGWEGVQDAALLKTSSMLHLELPPQSEQIMSTSSQYFRGVFSTMGEQGHYTLLGMYSHKDKKVHVIYHYMNGGGGEL